MENYTEVTTQSWLSRLGGSLKGIFFGLVLLIVSAIVLFWNEGRAVKRARALEEGATSVTVLPQNQVKGENEGKLVYVSGPLTSEETLRDVQFGVAAPSALKLRRTIKMYQWEEAKQSSSERKLGGSEETTTTYRYRKAWRSSPIRSEQFNVPEGHLNPASFAYTAEEYQSQAIKMGDFQLSAPLIAKVNQFEKLSVNPPDSAAAPMQSAGGNIYLGKGSLAEPQIGDYLVEFEVVRPLQVSIVAKQAGRLLTPYATRSGGSLALLQSGAVSSEAMFQGAEAQNSTFTWILRAAGFFCLFFGLNLLFKPLAVLGDVVPLIGNILRAGIGLVSGIVAFAFSLLIIALGWLFYRPILGISLLVVVAGCFLLLTMLKKRQSATHLVSAKS